MTAYQLSGPVPIERPVTLPADFPVCREACTHRTRRLTLLLVIGAGYAMWHDLPRQQMIVEREGAAGARSSDGHSRAAAGGRLPRKPSAGDPGTQEATDRLQAPASRLRPCSTSTDSSAGHGCTGSDAVAADGSPAASRRERAAWPAPKPRLRQSAPVAPPVVTVTPPPPPVLTPTQASARPRRPRRPLRPRPGSGGAAAGPQDCGGNRRPLPRSFRRCRPTRRSSRGPTAGCELRAPSGDVLTQTYVRAGESYTVPAGISYRIIVAR